jgi:NAD dependent epimerase/dehydratase family enzyme
MKVLITGATGFIGSHLCRHLLALGHEITAVTRKVDPVSAESVPGSQSNNQGFHSTFQKTGWLPPFDLQAGLDAMLRPSGHGEQPWYGKLSRKPD